ncbi:SDR family NAD(P)-dependent oxidoreductase [Actinokineospora sp.]|uniref:SDR family NAD(P)-dependent oxidoreductase n=1 Tax=Actinokineospora sp. TaxID=1872133 RepID=UPI0040383A93
MTGASSGIGAATAVELAGRGAAVALLARRQDRLAAVAERIRAGGGTAEIVELDVTDADVVAAAVETVVRRLGRLDTVVNNAGVMLLGGFESAPPQEWERMVSVNLTGLLHVTRAALPYLNKAAEQPPRQVADIVNISSMAGRKAFPSGGVYNATKFAVGAFSESLRQEVTSRHIRVSVVEPGVVATELASHNRPEVQAALSGQFADLETLRPEDVADLIGYVVTCPRHVAINEVLLRPTAQVF